jgi:hypothetical protein
MTFLVADQGAAPGGGAGAPVVEPAPAVATYGGIDCKAMLLQLLDLDPTADDAAIQAAFTAEEAEPEDDAAASQATSDLQVQLTAAQTRIAELETAAAQSQQDEINELIEEAGELPDDAKNALRTALSTDRAGGMALMAQMKKPAVVEAPAAAPAEADVPTAAAAPVDKTKAAAPPSPVHDPKAAAAATSEEDLAKKISDRAKELVKKSTNPKISLTKAYQLAETELKPAAA